MNHVKINQARINGQIQKCYTGVEKLVTPSMSLEDFEKCQKESQTPYYLESVVKGYTQKVLEGNDKEKIEKAEAEFKPLVKLNVFSEKGFSSVFYDGLDDNGDYKDNSVNRFLGRVK